MQINQQTGKHKLGKLYVGLLFTAILCLLATGCSHAVNFNINERFANLSPHTVAVLPIEWGDGIEKQADVSYIFRSMTRKKLQTLDYRSPELNKIDNRYLQLGSKTLGAKSYAVIADELGTDAVLSIKIIDWESNTLVTYAYLKVKARFTLHSRNGTKLWSAEYDTTDSDIKLDKASMELAIIKVYEPRVQRFINDVFSTLPTGNASKQRKTYFDWLP